MSRAAADRVLEAVKTEGGLLPADVLQRIASADKDIPGLSPADFHLEGTETISEAITRSWNRLLGVWATFRSERAKLPEGHDATTVTQNKWLLPFFSELGYGRLTKQPKGTFLFGEQTFELSHAYHHSPIHMVGAGVDLERRHASAAGAKQGSPHGVVQDFLNKSDAHLWAFASNGLRLRILRDHRSLTRLAYVELDLEAIFEGELFHAFRLVWLLCHQSRVEADKPEECWLEKWHGLVQKDGVAALDKLRDGVKAAIEALGRGFLRPENESLRELLATGKLDKQDYYRELLRLVYRLIFLFVTEDRDVLLDPTASPAARRRYEKFYATRRLRELARKRRGSAHGDLWQSMQVVMDLVSGEPEVEAKRAALGLPAFGGFLWSRASIEHLAGAQLANADLLAAVLALSTTEDARKQRYPVNWRSLGAEELGSVYEFLLELHPDVSKDAGTFELRTAPGNERKTTGSYYTPTSLVECLLDTALEPVVTEAVKGKTGKDAETAILGLTVCDPACGSGHFLLAAARRLARRLALVRADYAEPSPEEQRHALRDVVGKCIYGVDLNPMAAELCKVSLWLEAVEPGRPLSFLDSHIQVGNSLLGTTRKLMEGGIPDDAWSPIEGDDKEVAKALKKRNKAESPKKGGQRVLELGGGGVDRNAEVIGAATAALEGQGDAKIEDLRAKEAAWRKLQALDALEHETLKADAWCAAFVWKKERGVLSDIAPTNGTWLQLRDRREKADPRLVDFVGKLAKDYRFFHWELRFPQVFRAEAGGFDVVLGNPPWERIKLQEKEFFAARSPEIASAENASIRKKRIKALEQSDPALFRAWTDALRVADGESALVRASGRYPLCGRGDVNTYALFAELMRAVLSARGGIGVILPSGIATDDTTKLFFQDIVDGEALAALFHFENEAFVFPAVHHAFRFCLVSMSGRARKVPEATLVAYARSVAELADPAKQYRLSKADFAAINPNTRTFPTFRWARDAEITRGIHSRVPVLVREKETGDESPWGVSFLRMFDMANDSGAFRDREQLSKDGWKQLGNRFWKDGEWMLPLYEAKMVHHFDHRLGTYDGQTVAQERQGTLPQLTEAMHDDPELFAQPYYWVEGKAVRERLGDDAPGGLPGWRDVARATDKRTVIGSVIPAVGCGHKFPLYRAERGHLDILSSLFASFVVDYAARQRLGGTSVTYHVVKQIPVLPPTAFTNPTPWRSSEVLSSWVRRRIAELLVTVWDLEQFATQHDLPGPFRWVAARRSQLRAELDAAFFHLYGVSRDDVDWVMDTFHVVKEQDERAHGTYRTKDLILDVYDRMQSAIDGGEPFDTLLDPPPADPTLQHGPTRWRSAVRTDRDIPAFDARYCGGDVIEIRRHDLSDGEQARLRAHFGEPEWEQIGGQRPDGTLWDGGRLKLRGYFEFLARMETLPAPFATRASQD